MRLSVAPHSLFFDGCPSVGQSRRGVGHTRRPTPAKSRSQNQLRMKCAMLATKAPAPPSIYRISARPVGRQRSLHLFPWSQKSRRLPLTVLSDVTRRYSRPESASGTEHNRNFPALGRRALLHRQLPWRGRQIGTTGNLRMRRMRELPDGRLVSARSRRRQTSPIAQPGPIARCQIRLGCPGLIRRFC